jgi:hypothetical protein
MRKNLSILNKESGIFEARKIYLEGQSVNDFLPEAD